jgi:hypothetical protein
MAEHNAMSFQENIERSALTADLQIVGLVRLGPLPAKATNSYKLPFGSEHASVSSKFLLSVCRWSEARTDVAAFMPPVLRTLANILRSVLKSWARHLYRKERTAAVTGKSTAQLGNFVFIHELADINWNAPLCCDQPIECLVRTTV